MKKISTLLFVILFIFLFAAAPVLAYSEEEILDMTKIGVGIICVCADETRGDEETQKEKKVISFGTFFAVGNPDKPVHYLVTNFHCISDNNGNIAESLYIYTNDLKKSYPVSVVKFDANYDFAILKSTNALSDIYPLTLAHEDADLNDTVYAVGFPGEASLRYENGKYYYKLDPSDPTQTKGQITKLSVDNIIDGREIKDEYQVSTYISGGNSGGPVVNEKGNVIGIAQSKATDKEQVSFAVKISHIKDALDQAMITYDEEIGSIEVGVIERVDTVNEEASVTANASTASVNYAIKAIIIFVFLVSVFFFAKFFTKKKPNKNADQSLNESKTDESQDTAQKQELTKYKPIYKYMLKFFVKKDEQKTYEAISTEGILLSSNNKYPINADSFKLSNTSISSTAINNAGIGIEIGYGYENIIFTGKDCHIILWNKKIEKLVEEYTLSESKPKISFKGDDDIVFNVFATDKKYMFRVERISE